MTAATTPEPVAPAVAAAPSAARQGIEPVPAALRRLGGLDCVVLWGSLSVGLLVLAGGSLVVPALGLPAALGAIGVGSAIGGLIVGAIAWLAATTHVPGMVLLRAPLGVRGSYAPTALNVAQAFGWTVFEVIVIAHAARTAAGGPLALWTLVAAAIVTALAVGGPLVVVRRVLRAIGVPLTLAAGVYLSAWAASRLDWHAAAHGRGGLDFFSAVDIALAIPISWAPLVADYARFARRPRGALIGTATGVALANAWFYGLGALLVLVGAADPQVGVTRAAGVLVLGVLALAETDKPFADLYSTVVSLQNLRPRWPAPALAVAVGAAVAGTALVVPFTRYSSFLYLLGAFFVPLAGVQLAHAARLRRLPVDDLYRPDGAFGRVNGAALVAWVAGFAVYQWIAPAGVGAWHDALDRLLSAAGLDYAPASVARFGASLPSFAVAAALTLLLVRPRRSA